MRKLLLCCAVACVNAGTLLAAPLVLEQAGNVLKEGVLETGFTDISYQSDETKITNSAGATVYTLTRTAFSVPVFARYAFTPALETSIEIPCSSVSSKSESAGASTSASDSGIADLAFAGKYSFAFNGWDLAAGAAFSVPTGKESTKVPSSFKRGFNIKPLVAARKEMGCIFINANLSYAMNGEYTDENKVKQKFGDVLSLGAGAEYPVTSIAGLTLIGEAVFNSLAESKIAGAAQSGTSGSQYGLILGGSYAKGDLKTKLGFDLSLGEEKYRSYDYRIIAGATYLINL